MLLDALIQWAVHNRLGVVAVAAGFLVAGGYVATQMPVDVLPDVTAPTVTVLVEGHGLAPGDMGALVPSDETALKRRAGVRRVRRRAVGITVIWVARWGADTYRAPAPWESSRASR